LSFSRKWEKKKGEQVPVDLSERTKGGIAKLLEGDDTIIDRRFYELNSNQEKKNHFMEGEGKAEPVLFLWGGGNNEKKREHWLGGRVLPNPLQREREREKEGNRSTSSPLHKRG